MNYEIGLLPSGHLHCYPRAEGGDNTAIEQQITTAFSHHPAEGLFHLAIKGKALSTTWPVTFIYWRDFATHYLKARCLSAPEQDGIAPLDLLDEAQINTLLDTAPPMQGVEYLCADSLQALWRQLDDWLLEQLPAGGLSAFLADKAPQWHQVGRVCFHLAENKNDPDYPFAFMATYSQAVTNHGKLRYRPLSHALQEYAGSKNRQAMIKLLSPVSRAAENSPLITALYDSGDLYHPLAWRADEAYRFLKETPHYESSGILLRLPNWWQQRPRPKVGITLGDKKQSAVGANALLDFKLDIALGEQSLSRQELQQLMEMDAGLVNFKGQWVEVDQAKLQEALNHWETVATDLARSGLSFIEGMRLLAGAPADLSGKDTEATSPDWSFITPGKWLGTLLEQLRSPAAIQDAKPGKVLKATLRPYQQQGVNWLWMLSRLGLGTCLADDMGLGKTIQVITLLLLIKKAQQREKQKTPSLLVLPASLLSNWKLELARFAPSLRCLFVHSSEMDKASMAKLATNTATSLATIDAVLTTYTTLAGQSYLHDQQWHLVVLDEAQAIKNPATRQTKMVKRLNAHARIALTGTPVENRLGDLWSLFDFINPGLLGSAGRFKTFTKALASRDDNPYAPLRKLVQPYILRRLKTDRSIIDDLPDKTEIHAYCGLSKRQAALYQRSVRELHAALQPQDDIKRRGLVLAYMQRFKQICNHPDQMTGGDSYTPKDSGKFLRLAEICEEIASRQEKVLIFTQFRELTGALADYLQSVFARPGLILHGGTPVKQRQKRVDDFQREEGPPFFVLSIKAGGTGLNLTQASHVIHFDRWWNPAVENQATDRAFRIGQKNNVLVHKFVCRGTIEEKIDTMLNEKSALAADILEGGGEMSLTEMSNDEIMHLVSLDIDKANTE